MKYILSCPLCGKQNFKVVYKENFSENLINEDTFSARRLPDKIHCKIVKCRKCGLIFSNPTIENSDELYKKSKFTYQEEIDDLKESYAYYLERIKLASKKNFLEIGCGNGFFLEKALELGFENVVGVEPSIEAVNQSAVKDNIIVDVFKAGLFPDNQFDVICMFQTFDHVSSPNEFLTDCYKCLKKDGIILAINHNIGALTAKFLGERCPMIDIEHPILYDKNTLREIFVKNNFKVEKVFSVKNNYPIYYWIKLLPFPKRLKSVLVKIFSNMKGLKLKLSAGNMGIVAKK